MNDIDKLLIENCKEALRLVQNSMILSFSSAASALAIVLVNPERIQVANDLLPMEVPARSAIGVLIALYWVFGMVAAYSIYRVRRIVDLLHGVDKDEASAKLRNMTDEEKAQIAPTSHVRAEAQTLSPLSERAKLVKAVLTYPAIPTIATPLPRLVASIVGPVLVVICLVEMFGAELVGVLPAFAILVLLLPHFALSWELRTPIGGFFF